MKNIQYIIAFLLLWSNWSCDDFERDLDIDLPAQPSELVIECYLEAGKPYRLLLTETKDYLEDLDACPFVRNALVVISHNGQRDTLQEATFFNNDCKADDIIPYGFIPYISDDTTRFYNYGSSQICVLDYSSPFQIEVWDTANNRYATAITQMLPPVPISDLTTEFNDQGKAYCLFGCQDPAATVDFYRMMLHQTSLTKRQKGSPIPVANNPETDAVIDDARLFSGKKIVLGTLYKYEVGDTLIATIYHIDQSYHDYLESSRDAESANGNPFGQPATVLSNVQGGRGIFTFLSYDRDTIIVDL